jgi:hypothetical protein
MKNLQNSAKKAETESKTERDPKLPDGAHAHDTNREDPMNGAHQGSTGQRDKHDR